jgi:quinone-modifying oxidoreductase subunit QmoC
LALALLAKGRIEEALGPSTLSPERVVFSYSSFLPHWLLNSFFLFFGALALLAALIGVMRFWRVLKKSGAQQGFVPSGKSVGASVWAALKKIITHENFTTCTTESSRLVPHFCVFFGFVALLMVTFWVITNSLNPLIQGAFVYPFGFLNPLKILANLGGLAVIVGCGLMIFDRLYGENASSSTYSDWAFLWLIVAVVATGFATELLHYARLEPHRHVIYFVHLVFAFSLIVYLPYSKFAHLVYRTAALTFVEYTNRGEVKRAGTSEAMRRDEGRDPEAAGSVA